jgi:hypothetical protein
MPSYADHQDLQPLAHAQTATQAMNNSRIVTAFVSSVASITKFPLESRTVAEIVLLTNYRKESRNLRPKVLF